MDTRGPLPSFLIKIFPGNGPFPGIYNLSAGWGKTHTVMKNDLKSLWAKLKHIWYYKMSFSLEGEDILLSMLFNGKNKGFFVDVGANHPFKISNTFYFYQLGWRGINIDPNPGCMELFQKVRPGDINVQAAISDLKREAVYNIFDAGELNHIDGTKTKEEMEDLFARGYKLIEQRKVNTETLTDVLDKYAGNGVEIDFVSIDVEGSEINVLNSLDWRKYRPKIVLVENSGLCSIEEIKNSDVYGFLSGRKYQLFAKTYYNLIFKDEEYADGEFFKIT